MLSLISVRSAFISFQNISLTMPDSFQLVMPEPDPDEEPLEVEGQVVAPPVIIPQQPAVNPPADSIASLSRSYARERESHLGSFEIRQPENEEHSPEEMLIRDPDELWQENAKREAEDDFRFSLAEMFFVTALLAVIFTVGRYIGLPTLAGVLGALVLVGMVVISNRQRSRLSYVIWITLIAGYVIISIGAAWTTGK
jgi:hypothetical protein